MEDFIYLTQEGYDKLKEELEYLKNIRRREISKEIEKARSFGDLRENAEYESAKEAQALNEKRILELEEKLSRAIIISEKDIAKNEVRIGTKVKLKDLDTDEEIIYILVSEIEADYSQGKISIISPIGKALLGHKKDDVVEIKIPSGILRYKILEITFSI